MRRFKLVLAILLFALISPAFLTLVGCGATPVNDVKAVYFDSEIYDTNGYAVFELDLYKPTILKTKINPSGWHGELIFNAINTSPTNAMNFDMEAHFHIYHMIEDI